MWFKSCVVIMAWVSAAAPIQLLAQEFPYAVGAAVRRKKILIYRRNDNVNK